MARSRSTVEIEKYPLYKKVILITLALIYASICCFARFALGAHSLDQILLGFLLGVWLALTYFCLLREIVHRHITELVTGRSATSNKVFYLVSLGIWLVAMLIVTITFLIVKEKPLEYQNTIPVYTVDQVESIT